MVLRITTAAVVLVVLLAIGAALFRVYTAPERRAQRLQVAKETCVKSGGEWAVVGDEPICKRS